MGGDRPQPYCRRAAQRPQRHRRAVHRPPARHGALHYRTPPSRAGGYRRRRLDGGLAAGLLGLEALLVVSVWGPQPVAWLWVGSQVDYRTGSVSLGLLAAFAGLLAGLLATLAVAGRLDDARRLLRRAAGHDQREGVLGRLFMVTAVLAAVGFAAWFLLLDGPAPSLAPR